MDAADSSRSPSRPTNSSQRSAVASPLPRAGAKPILEQRSHLGSGGSSPLCGILFRIKIRLLPIRFHRGTADVEIKRLRRAGPDVDLLERSGSGIAVFRKDG